MKHIVNFSFGIGSWAEAKLTAKEYGTENVLLLNADTKYEDEDTYTWGQAAAKNVGAELVTIADGRDVWEVFRDERYLGNTRADPCSKILKRQLCDRWIEKHYTPETCVRHYGIHWSEMDRLTRIQDRMWPWRAVSRLCLKPFIAYQELHEWAKREGLWQQKLYALGFAHANCGGRCVKQGQGGWLHLLKVMPERFKECEDKEQGMREFLGKDISILRDRRGGETKPLTLKELRERFQMTGQGDLFDIGGCSCFAGDE